MPDDANKKSNDRTVGQIDLSAFGYVERRRAVRPGTPAAESTDGVGGAHSLHDPVRAERAQREYLRNRALRIDHLGLIDDEPPPDLKIIGVNNKGLRVGYNPYDSGRLAKQEWKKPRDLRALSKWIESQRPAAGARREDEDESR